MKDSPFTEARLLSLYDRVAEAEDAIPRLRRFVLDLAVRGKLVAQEAGDEPASVLLERVEKEKARLVKAGAYRSSKMREVEPALVPYVLPQTWAWVALGNLFIYDAGEKRDPGRLVGDMWLLELEDVEKDTGRVLSRLPVSARESLSTKSEFQIGDILYGKLRPYLNKVVVADEAGYSTTEIVAIRPYLPMCSEYCALALRRPDFVDYVTRLGQGTKMPRLRTEDALVSPFPLPPLAEQHRIVAKVEELMALLDRLEATRAAREETRTRLTTATLSRLTEADTDTPTAARFALQTLPALTTRPDQIKTLRQTILNLAVRGKLVAQDARDEPADNLVVKLRAKVASQSSGRARGRRSHENGDRGLIESPLFEAPAGWAWVQMGELGETNIGLTYSPNDVGPHGVPVLRSNNIQDGRLDLYNLVRVNMSPKSSAMVSNGDMIPKFNSKTAK
jgi:type I restriction enzyme S subunit